MTTWADTSDVPKPEHDTSWHRAAWLLGRHPRLAALLDRTGLAKDDPADPGRPDLELDDLAEAFLELVRLGAAWKERESSKPRQRPGEGDHAYDVRLESWYDEGPQPSSPAAAALGPMSSTEVGHLRLLATLARTVRVPFHVADLSGFDEEGQRLIADWCRLLQR